VDVVLNWLAQGAIVGIAASAGLRVMPPSHTQARYSVVWVAYLLVLALPSVPTILAIAFDPAVDVATTSAGGVVTLPAVWWTSPALAMGLWIGWSGACAVQIGLSAVAVHRARRRAPECPRCVLARLPRWSHVSATGRPTRVVLSSAVRVAGVLGCGTPVIALAPGIVEELNVADLDRVLVHEWAHVQRRDDVAQFVQRLVRAVVGWHPVAWWLERQLEFEREVACDEIAVRETGSARGYAACLAALAALPAAPVRSVPVLAAASPSRLHRRIVRILALPCAAAVRPWRAAATCGGVGLMACAVVIGNVQVVSSKGTVAPGWTAAPAGARAVVNGAPEASRLLEPTASRLRPVPRGSQRSGGNVRPVTREHAAAPVAGTTDGIDEPPIASISLPPSHWPLDASLPIPIGIRSSDTPISAPGGTPALALTGDGAPHPEDKARAAWTRAADAGVAIGRISHGKGSATAGFFSRFGRKVAGSF
jgi:beta-lactamase regulating signal transducer with metallopeptidase domain